ncbi:MAG: 50S ribosomal protein L25 [Wigglesworthia glossinidia]|nr:50S ribosomal protein L25 [Wigglesworthia glossinidia]
MLNLIAKYRFKLGKKASRRMRQIDNCIPAIIYGKNKPSVAITIYCDVISNFQYKKDFYFKNICLNFEKEKKIIVKIKSVQRHAFKPKIIHIDFLYF